MRDLRSYESELNIRVALNQSAQKKISRSRPRASATTFANFKGTLHAAALHPVAMKLFYRDLPK
jgi:hypothetical protein